jgi:Flp pilus assembly protein TadG
MNGIDSRGQAIVELALVLFLLVLLVMGIFEFGRAMYIKNTLTHAARAGARAGVVTPGLISPVSNTGCTSASTAIATACNNLYSGIDKSKVIVKLNVYAQGVDPNAEPNNYKTTDSTTPPVAGDTVKVTVTLTGVTSIVPKLITVLPNTLSGDTAMRYE